MRAETEAPARSEAVAMTVSPSTSRTGVKVTSPSAEPSFSTWTRSPSATRSCLPPVLITAFIDRPCYLSASPRTEPADGATCCEPKGRMPAGKNPPTSNQGRRSPEGPHAGRQAASSPVGHGRPSGHQLQQRLVHDDAAAVAGRAGGGERLDETF